MDGLRHTLQGSFVYLLVLQILVITGLFLTLIWMLIKRTRENSAVTAGASLPITPAVPENLTSAPVVEAVKPIEVPAQEQKISPVVVVPEQPASPIPTDSVATVSHETELALKNEHIQYLETKLCEFEILQEEIGILKELRTENEALKKQLDEIKIKNSENVVPIRPPAEIPPVDPGLNKLMADIEAIATRKD